MDEVISFPRPAEYYPTLVEAGNVAPGLGHLTPSAAMEMGKETRRLLLQGSGEGLNAHSGLDCLLTLALLVE